MRQQYEVRDREKGMKGDWGVRCTWRVLSRIAKVLTMRKSLKVKTDKTLT